VRSFKLLGKAAITIEVLSIFNGWIYYWSIRL